MKAPRLTKIALSMVAIVFAFLFLVPAFFPWTPVNCEHQEIDLLTGRARFIQMRFFVPISTRYEHTPISEALGISNIDSPTGDWKRVNTFSPGVQHSPHYRHHGALSQANNLGLMWQVTEFADEARRESASTVMRLWRDSGGDSGAREFLYRLGEAYNDKVTLADVRSLANRGEQVDDAN